MNQQPRAQRARLQEQPNSLDSSGSRPAKIHKKSSSQNVGTRKAHELKAERR